MLLLEQLKSRHL